MHKINPYVTFFIQGIEVMRVQGHNDLQMIIRFEETPDYRGYNKPTAPELAVIMPSVGYGEEASSRDILLHAALAELKYTALMMRYTMLFSFPR